MVSLKKAASSILDKLVDEISSEPKKEVVVKEEKAGEKESKPTKKTNNEMEERVGAMSDLLAREEVLVIPKVGDVLPGIVLDVSPNVVYLDLGPIGTGVVMGKEIRDGLGTGKLKIGDEVTATLVELDNEDGHIELSIREASYEKAWEDLERKKEEKESFLARILDANKGGLMVEVNGITGFLPVSQLSSDNYPRVEDGDKTKILDMLKRLIGKELTTRIIDTDQVNEKLIVSERAAMSDKEREKISSLKVGDVISGEVSGVVDFGAFVKFNPAGTTQAHERLEGLVHISELAWQLIDNPRDIIKTGEQVEAKVIGIDDTRISLSIKALKEDPWVKVHEKYNPGDTVTGKVDKISHFGAFVYLDKDIHGLAHVSEFQQSYPGKKLEESVEVGKEYEWKILSIEEKTHRMGLVLVIEKDKKKEKDSDQKTEKTEKKEKKATTKKAEKKEKTEKTEKKEKTEEKEVK
ncbi:MAG: S1 RNA-binding domain-containing protein [Candidatus Moranbacteria bacterium]|nr:S1 RNA-binding domain-containing protein [Candidatus Moranbacteria bacterium]